MEMWRCDGASFVSMELNGSHVELTRRGAKRNSVPPFVQQWNSDLYSDLRPVQSHVSLPKIDKWLTWSFKMAVREGSSFLTCYTMFFTSEMTSSCQGRGLVSVLICGIKLIGLVQVLGLMFLPWLEISAEIITKSFLIVRIFCCSQIANCSNFKYASGFVKLW